MKTLLFIIFTVALIISIAGLVKQKDEKLNLQELVDHELSANFNYGFDIEKENIPNRKFVSDTAHQSISFKTKHWGIYDIIGWFEYFDIVCYYDNTDFSDAIIEARIYPKTINMPNNRMQEHIKKEEFFHVENYPVVYFKSDSMYQVADSTYKVDGKMTIKGIEKPITLDAKLNGYVYPERLGVPGFTINGAIDRTQFELAGMEKLQSNNLDFLAQQVFFTCNLRLEPVSK